MTICLNGSVIAWKARFRFITDLAKLVTLVSESLFPPAIRNEKSQNQKNKTKKQNKTKHNKTKHNKKKKNKTKQNKTTT